MDEVIKRLRKRAGEIKAMLDEQLDNCEPLSSMHLSLALDVLALIEAADVIERAQRADMLIGIVD